VRSLRALSFDIGNQICRAHRKFDPHDSAALAEPRIKKFLARYRRPGAATAGIFSPAPRTRFKNSLARVGSLQLRCPNGRVRPRHGNRALDRRQEVSRYYYGIDFSPRDLRLGLIEAAEARIGTPIDQLLLFLFSYDPSRANTVFSSPT